MFYTPYQMLRKRLLEIEGIPAVSWFNAQYDPDRDEAVYNVPHVYVEFSPVAVRDYRENVQGGNLTVRIRLFTEHYDDEKRLAKHFDFVRSIYQKLHGWQAKLSFLPEYADLMGDECDRTVLNKLSRVSIEPDHGQTNTVVTIQEFTCGVVDVDAARTYTQVDADLVIIRP